MQVDEIALLNTTLRKMDGGALLYPNIAMAASGVQNLSRSGLHNDYIKVNNRLRSRACRLYSLVTFYVKALRPEAISMREPSCAGGG